MKLPRRHSHVLSPLAYDPTNLMGAGHTCRKGTPTMACMPPTYTEGEPSLHGPSNRRNCSCAEWRGPYVDGGFEGQRDVWSDTSLDVRDSMQSARRTKRLAIQNARRTKRLARRHAQCRMSSHDSASALQCLSHARNSTTRLRCTKLMAIQANATHRRYDHIGSNATYVPASVMAVLQ